MEARLTGSPEANSKSLKLDDDNSNSQETDDQILEKSKINKEDDPDEKNETFRVVGINGVTYETRDNLIRVSYLDNLIINIEYDDRFALADNKELKERFKEHVLIITRGKLLSISKSNGNQTLMNSKWYQQISLNFAQGMDSSVIYR